MLLTKSLPIEALLKAGLEDKVKSSVIKRIVDKHMAAAQQELENVLKEELAGFCIKSIEHFRDLAEVTDDYIIRAYLNEEELDIGNKK